MSSFVDNCPYVLSPRQLQNLKDETSEDGLTILDVSWHMPNSPRNALQDYTQKHIPGALRLDLDEVASPHELGLKHMLPTPEIFAKACEELGISRSSHVVLYDTTGVFSSPRALYMFRAFGHKRSSILDGGLPNWLAHGGMAGPQFAPVPKAEYDPPQLDVDAVRSKVKSLKDIEAQSNEFVTNSAFDPSSPETELVLDARSRGRFLGTDPEPRPGLPSGHIPHSRSLPFTSFLQQNEVTLQPSGEKITFSTLATNKQLLAALEEALGAEYAKDVLAGKRGVVTSCGSGMTAGVLWLGLQVLGVERVGLYDESWTGYAAREGSLIVKGEQ
ncbi:Rhodanese-like domain-containing protein [Irpex rosettiformis]|uniref:Rhodanese-like domain-containing protein n=1 Tax=Irpex rosettiformis TaxID=378272 RepID=A0ACB8TUA6_9APHY|nr:Rhodanese-like domain-containing protein [Irpex rosettiformis]